MKRRLHNFLTLLSVLLGVAVSVVWARSTRCVEEVGANAVAVDGFDDVNGREWSSYRRVSWGGGLLVVSWGRGYGVGAGRAGYTPEMSGWFYERVSDNPPDLETIYGSEEPGRFARQSITLSRGALAVDGTPVDPDQGYKVSTHHWVRLPLWPVLLAAAALPAMRTARAIRQIRAVPLSRSVCRSCGYDLRATPHRCPECGRPASSPP